MIKFRLLFLLCCLFLLQGVNAQTVTLKQLYSTARGYDVKNPVMMDSINIKGNKFENKNLLETYISFPDQNAYTELLKSDLSGYFLLSKAQQGAKFYLLSFQLNIDKYAKTVVKISAPSMFEAYINGVKETSKVTVEDTLTSSKTVKLTFP